MILLDQTKSVEKDVCWGLFLKGYIHILPGFWANGSILWRVPNKPGGFEIILVLPALTGRLQANEIH